MNVACVSSMAPATVVCQRSVRPPRALRLRLAAAANGGERERAGSSIASMGRRATGLALLGAVVAPYQRANASGIESIDLVDIPRRSAEELAAIQAAQKEKLRAADEQFENSELLATLRAKSEANKDKNSKDLQTKYCMRQAELGVGDCGGLRYIPGATKSGKQKTPKWLQNFLGVDVGDQPDVDIKF